MKLRIATSVAAAAVLALGVGARNEPRRRIRELEAEIRALRPGEPLAHGVDHKGPWARVGDVGARARPDCEAALQALLDKIRGAVR